MLSKIIQQSVRELFKANELEQIGRSRTWKIDQLWYSIQVEFQPLSGYQATCINVGIGFHWYPKDYFSFDIGHRASDFVYFENPEQFAQAMTKLALLALDQVAAYQTAMADPERAVQTILQHRFSSDELWGNFHRGTICGLTQDFSAAERYYKRLLTQDLSAPFEQKLAVVTRQLLTRLRDKELFRLAVLELIAENRRLNKLPERTLSMLF